MRKLFIYGIYLFYLYGLALLVLLDEKVTANQSKPPFHFDGSGVY